MPWAWSSLITQLAKKVFYFPWNRTLVICSTSVLYWSCPTTTGDRMTDKLLRLPSLDIFPGGISLEININPRREGDVDHLLHPPFLGMHLQTLTKEAESRKDRNILTRRGEDDILLLLLFLLLLYLIISHMIMEDTKEVDIVSRLHRTLAFCSPRK